MKQLVEYCKQVSSIDEYLSTKNIKSKDEIEYDSFCQALYLKSDKYEAKKLYEYFKNNCENVIGDNLENDQRLSTDFELIYMAAAMLNDDSEYPPVIYKLGHKYYKGINNPYDFSWFEEQNANKKDVLMIMQDLYSSDNKFREIFDDVYKCIEKCCTKYHYTIDGIWNLQNVLEY